jgi:hypothetical protein
MSGHQAHVRGSVYFIRRRDGEGPIKIGFSTQSWARLGVLDCASPYPLQMLATLAGPKEMEFRFHHQFFGDHLRGEWFNPSAGLLAAIEAIRNGSFDPETLPESINVTAARRRPKGPWTEEQKDRARRSRSARREALLAGGRRRPPNQSPDAAEPVAATG